MRRFFLVLLISVIPTVLLAQANRGPSTPEERQRAIAVAQSLEQNPLGPNAQNDRQWITIWLIQIPDITVSVCTATLAWEKNYKYSSELMGAELASSAAYIIQHPEKSKDSQAVGIAGLESALKAYTIILQSNSSAHSKKMDEMLKLQANGTLADDVAKQWKKECK